MTGDGGYDAHADWYADYLDGPAERHTRRTSDALRDAVGAGRGLCVDLGCGTGIHAATVQQLGWQVVGIDASHGQLRHARGRLPVAGADATRVPMASRSVDLVVATLLHTDVEDWAATVREATRILRPGGRFVHVGVHPCFVGPFAGRTDDEVRIHPGYRLEERTFDGPGMGQGIRRRVGVRHRTLASLVNPVLEAGLALVRVTEPADGPTPDLLVLEATA